MEQHIDFIQHLVAKGGPEPSEYDAFTCWLHQMSAELCAGQVTHGDLATLREAFGPAVSTATIQGLCLAKPRGYAGDFEMMERLYLGWTADDPTLKKWDLYLHSRGGPAAVRNRVAFFVRLLSAMVVANGRNGPVPVLNLGSGAARDVFAFSCQQNGSAVFDCVDWEKDAVDYAQNLCADYMDAITFTKKNVLRFKTHKRYRFVWSAGLFDYFDEQTFKYMIRRLLSFLDQDGELVIGNVTEGNPAREHMEIVTDWWVYHRTPERLAALARACGVARKNFRIFREPAGVFLFLHIKRGEDFIPLDLNIGSRRFPLGRSDVATD